MEYNKLTMEKVFAKINKFSLYFFLFFIPIFFLPFSQNVLDFPKQIFATFLILFSLFGWLGQSLFQKKLVLKLEKKFYLILFLIFLSSLISLFFSPLGKISFFGFPFEVSDSGLTLFLLLIFIFLLVNLNEKIDFLKLIFYFLISIFILGVFNLFQIYGIYFLPFDFAKNNSFTLLGNQNSFSLFCVILFPLCFLLFLKSQGNIKIFFGLLNFVLFFNILAINFKFAWFLLFLEISILLIFGLERKIKISFLLFSLFFLTLSLFFYFFPLSFKIFPQFLPEISLSIPTQVFIIKKAFCENIKNILFGTGPETFSFVYSLFRPPQFNQDVFWGTRFIKGYSTFFDWVLTKGILFSLFLLVLLALSFYSALQILKKRDEFFELKLAFTSALAGIIFSIFLYPLNFSLLILFGFLIGAIFFFKESKILEINLSSPNLNILINAVFIFSFLSFLFLGFLQIQRYLAEFYYWQGLKEAQKLNYDLAINFLQKAINFNPDLDIYWRDLSQIFLAKANFISQNANLSIEEKRNKVNLLIVQGGEAINKAISLFPNNVANWNVRGFFYQNLIGIEGAEKIALESYQKAIQLEPSSPYPFGERGRIYILLAQNFSQKGEEEKKIESLKLAISELETALKLKSDYAPAHYLLAVAFDQLGEREKAIAKLEETKLLSPNDLGVSFQLGILYWRKNDLEKAKKEFERILKLNPEYVNASYMLGLVLEKMGEREKAISEFEKILAKDPNNEEVKKILENLKKGISPLEGILSQSQVQEFPPEIKK